MTHKVTGGVVSVEDGTKKNEEYAPPRKVRVELHFEVDEGADANTVLSGVAALANSHVAKLLGSKPTVITPEPAKPTAKDELAKAAGVDAASVAAATAPKAAGSRTRKPPKEEAPLPAAEVVDEAVVEETPAVDEFAVAEPAAKEITDKDLHDAMSRKAGELKNPVPVREVVAKFKPANHNGLFTAQQIPQNQRDAFIKAVVALKAA